VRSTRPQQSRSVCSGNPVLCARKYGFVGCLGRCEQLLVATSSSFPKGAFQNDMCRFESSMPSQPVRFFLFDFRLCENCRHSRGLCWCARASGRQIPDFRDSSGASRRMYRSPCPSRLAIPSYPLRLLGFLAFLGAIGVRAGGANVLRGTARVIFSGRWRRSRKEDAHAEARNNRRGRRSSGSPLHYVLFALPPVTSRRDAWCDLVHAASARPSGTIFLFVRAALKHCAVSRRSHELRPEMATRLATHRRFGAVVSKWASEESRQTAACVRGDHPAAAEHHCGKRSFVGRLVRI
jgi:hypothetical protein